MSRPTDPPPTVVEVSIASDGREVRGELRVPEHARGAVAFAHGSGSGRYSARNRFVAQELRRLSLATLLIDLLTAEEETIDLHTRHLRFDVGLLGRRLVAATDWLAGNPHTSGLAIGYFGASTGAGAALVAAAHKPDLVRAVVSRGGRPDLAGAALPYVKAPTLLIVGGNDEPVIGLNRRAMAQLRAPHELTIVPGATHLFEERGKLDEVARLSRDWFKRYLTDKEGK